MHHGVPAIRSVSCVSSPLPALAILSVLLASRPRTALHLHLCHLSCSLIQIDKVRLRAQLAQFIFIMLSVLPPIIRLICWRLADEILAAMRLNIVPITRLLAPAAFIKRFGIALLVTTRVRRIEQFVEVKVLQYSSCFFFVLLSLLVFRLLLPAFLVWTNSIPHEFFLICCILELGVFEQLLQAVSPVASLSAAVPHFIIISLSTPKFKFWALALTRLSIVVITQH